MWLFRRAVTAREAVEPLCHQASRLPRRLRERLAPLGIPQRDGFELESLALIHAVALQAIQNSAFDVAARDRLQDAFSPDFAERMLRLRLTGTTFILHRPLEAPLATQTRRNLTFDSHARLELFSLREFLWARGSAYRAPTGVSVGLEATIDRYLGYLEAPPTLEARFSLAVFVTDTREDLGHTLVRLWRTRHLL